MKAGKYELAAALERTHKALSDLLGFVDGREVHGSVSNPAHYFNCYGNALAALAANRAAAVLPNLSISCNLADAEAAFNAAVSPE